MINASGTQTTRGKALRSVRAAVARRTTNGDVSAAMMKSMGINLKRKSTREVVGRAGARAPRRPTRAAPVSIIGTWLGSMHFSPLVGFYFALRSSIARCMASQLS